RPAVRIQADTKALASYGIGLDTLRTVPGQCPVRGRVRRPALHLKRGAIDADRMRLPACVRQEWPAGGGPGRNTRRGGGGRG
ncbi:hypothetical protein, partial [Paracidovorax avenae]|uniref:hypothetical protein n=1 Tax=Paracidovorax avenae TaxID=80867 RepID=UPI001CEFAD24